MQKTRASPGKVFQGGALCIDHARFAGIDPNQEVSNARLLVTESGGYRLVA